MEALRQVSAVVTSYNEERKAVKNVMIVCDKRYTSSDLETVALFGIPMCLVTTWTQQIQFRFVRFYNCSTLGLNKPTLKPFHQTDS